MDSILELLGNSGITAPQALMFILLLLVLPLLALFASQLRAGKRIPLRPIRAFERLGTLIGQSAETGQPVHMSLGVGGVVDPSTAESLAGLALMEHVATEATACGAPLTVTVSDPTLLPLAQDTSRRAWETHPYQYQVQEPEARLIAPDPTAYAAGVMDILLGERVAANIMVGRFGPEYLLMGETGVKSRVPQVVGAADPQVLPFVHATADEMLIGEEMFAVGAYLRPKTAHIASLRVQDWLRVFLILTIVLGVLLRSL
ncbi:MAG: DUF6754 domain-containing protein [Anaerolineae bacterium]